jgi:hypothetical protein
VCISTHPQNSWLNLKLMIIFLSFSKASKLPVHLRRFTAPWLFTKICSRGVELLQRNKQYNEAVQLLRQLLAQDTFCTHHRGRWWERLALNLDQHLKRPAEVSHFDVVPQYCVPSNPCFISLFVCLRVPSPSLKN